MAATPTIISSDVAALQATGRYHHNFRMAMPYAISGCAFQALLLSQITKRTITQHIHPPCAISP